MVRSKWMRTDSRRKGRRRLTTPVIGGRHGCGRFDPAQRALPRRGLIIPPPGQAPPPSTPVLWLGRSGAAFRRPVCFPSVHTVGIHTCVSHTLVGRVRFGSTSGGCRTGDRLGARRRTDLFGAVPLVTAFPGIWQRRPQIDLQVVLRAGSATRTISSRPHRGHLSVCLSQPPRTRSTRISRSGLPHWRQNGLSLGSGRCVVNAVP